MQQLAPYQLRMKEYREAHCACPVCGSTEYETTCKGFFLKDDNKITCSCGWARIGDELVGKKNTQRKSTTGLTVEVLIEKLQKAISEGTITKDAFFMMPKDDNHESMCVLRGLDSVQYAPKNFGGGTHGAVFLNPIQM